MKYLENFHSGVLKYMPWPKIEVKRNFSKQMCLGVILMLYLYVIKQWYINKPLLKPIGKIYKSFTRSTFEALHSKNKIVKKLWSENGSLHDKTQESLKISKVWYRQSMRICQLQSCLTNRIVISFSIEKSLHYSTVLM